MVLYRLHNESELAWAVIVIILTSPPPRNLGHSFVRHGLEESQYVIRLPPSGTAYLSSS